MQEVQRSEVDFNWVIEDPEGNEVGTIGLYNIEWNFRKGEIGRLLIGRRDLRRMGFARKAFLSVLQAADAEGIKEINLCVIGDNLAAYNLYVSLGFTVDKKEGGSTFMKIFL